MFLAEIKAAKSYGMTLSQWIDEPRWARKYMYAEYIASMQIESVLAEEAREEAERLYRTNK